MSRRRTEVVTKGSVKGGKDSKRRGRRNTNTRRGSIMFHKVHDVLTSPSSPLTHTPSPTREGHMRGIYNPGVPEGSLEGIRR